MSDYKAVIYAAKCLMCPNAVVMVFSEYDRRADWVGDHRTKTGHPVRQWIGVDL